MAYSEEYLGGAVVPASNAYLTARSLVASASDYASWYIGEEVILTRIMFLVTTTTLTGLVAPVVTFYARPTFGSSSGQISLGTLTIPTATAAGTILYKNIESVKLPQGYTLTVAGTTQGTDGGSAAGAGFAMFKAFMGTEDPKNVSAMVASA